VRNNLYLLTSMFLLFSIPAHAAITLADGNSALEIDGDPPDGWVTGWWVDGDNGEIDTTENHLNEMTWWIRFPGDTRESFLPNAMSFSGSTDNTATFTYKAGNLSGILRYRLKGGAPASGQSKFIQDFTLTNNGAGASSFTLFQYTDLDVNFFPDNDTARYLGPGTIEQSDEEGTTVTVKIQGIQPSAWDIATAPDLLDQLDDDGITTLDSSPNELSGDVEFAFQWDIRLAPGESITLQTVHAVPVPAAIWLFGSAFMMIFGLGKRHRYTHA